MLYKKYHRNYVRRLKKGTKFKFNYSPTIFSVMDEPVIAGDKLLCIRVKCWDNLIKNFSYTFITLILCTGRFTGIVDKRIIIM